MVSCCLEHAASVAKTFLISDFAMVDNKEPMPLPVPARNPMDNSGSIYSHPDALTSFSVYQSQV